MDVSCTYAVLCITWNTMYTETETWSCVEFLALFCTTQANPEIYLKLTEREVNLE